MIMATLVGQEELSNTPKRTQTFQATHDGAGNSLPLYLRSFLSFSYGGKAIEEFSLIVTYEERIEKGLYSEFEDSTSDYTTVDGQYYWGTRMEPLELEFTLSTDYMDQKTMEDFKAWFRPGVERELILAEHPNRYIMARVSEPPEMDMTPFGEEVEVEINEKKYKTMTTVYRGDITLNFIMDYPYWTGILNYMPYLITMNEETNNGQASILLKQLKSAESINTLSSKDALKICLEDNIPHDLALYSNENFVLGNKDLYTEIILSHVPGTKFDPPPETYESESDLYKETTSNAPKKSWPKTGQTYIQYVPASSSGDGPDIAVTDYSDLEEQNGEPYSPIVTNYNVNSVPMDLLKGQKRFLFYSGTAPSRPIISFNFKIEFDSKGWYITNPINSIASEMSTALPTQDESAAAPTKSYIQVGSTKFEFTTPGILTAYNKAIQIVDEIKSEASVYDLKKEFREKVKDKYMRAWCIYSLSKPTSLPEADNVTDDMRTNIKTRLKGFFVPKLKVTTTENDEQEVQNVTTNEYYAFFTFDSKTGISTGEFNVQVVKNQESKAEIITENVGDMVLSNYLIINERNVLENGIIKTKNCTPITTNENLSNFSIVYDNMYY